MRTRKAIKKRAKEILRKHYLLLIAVCVVASFIGAESTASLFAVRIQGPVKSEEEVIQKIEIESIEKAKEEAKQAQEIIETRDNNKILGRTRGVFSSIINSVATGSIYIRLIQAISSIVQSKSVSVAILILLSLFLTFLIWYFIVDIYQVISRRIFLEARIYKIVSKRRFTYLLSIKKWNKVAWTMFLKSFYQSLWSLTIVGGIIKRYSYFLVPYIVAENPNISARDAITLSRNMMNHHKWECFVLELTFFGWEILGTLTLGITQIFYSNAYKIATFSEYYTDLRKIAKENKMPLSNYLNDTYLFETAKKEVLEEKYKDIVALMKEPKEKRKEKKDIRTFLSDTFGIATHSVEEEKRIEEEQIKKSKIRAYKDIITGKSYPNRLFTIPEKQKRMRVEYLNYLRHYSITSLILIFFILSFIGWIWEVSLHLISNGVFVNRGVLHGPWLPIYGSGAILILIVLNKFRKVPLLEFITTIILCGVVEYGTAYYLEMTHNGVKWWDYSGYFLNLNGRICAEGLLVFGLGGFAIVYVLAPIIDNIAKRIGRNVLIPICAILLGIFMVDQIYSSNHPNIGKGITDYAMNEVKKMEYRRE